jgi:AcrR family transcriptional regulator
MTEPRPDAPAAARRPNRDAILAVAERAFARDGYAGTSLRRLITEAGVSTTAFYARFPSKEAVLDALLGALLRDLYETAQRTLTDTGNLAQSFDAGVELLVRALEDRRPLVRVALTEGACSPTSRATMQAAFRLLADLLAARVKARAKRGKATGVDADAFGWALVGALHLQIVRWAVYEELDGEGLAHALRATARAMMPAVR